MKVDVYGGNHSHGCRLFCWHCMTSKLITNLDHCLRLRHFESGRLYASSIGERFALGKRVV